MIALGLLTWAILRDADGSTPPEIESTIQITRGDRVVLRGTVDQVRAMSVPDRRRWIRAVPAGRRTRVKYARVVLRTDYAKLDEVITRLVHRGGGITAVPERAISSSSALPVVKQRLRNNCETAALSMVLAAEGVRVPQLQLQKELPRSGPLDPRPSESGATTVWGDPREGFVGRPEGGGVAGGYGVYEKPIVGVARRHKIELQHVGSRSSAKPIYRALLHGQPVMVWIGLSDGPYRTWLTPDGEPFTGNFGEHTVVLVGVDGDKLAVNDPLSGQRLTWTRSDFELMWERLDRQALTLTVADGPRER